MLACSLVVGSSASRLISPRRLCALPVYNVSFDQHAPRTKKYRGASREKEVEVNGSDRLSFLRLRLACRLAGNVKQVEVCGLRRASSLACTAPSPVTRHLFPSFSFSLGRCRSFCSLSSLPHLPLRLPQGSCSEDMHTELSDIVLRARGAAKTASDLQEHERRRTPTLRGSEWSRAHCIQRTGQSLSMLYFAPHSTQDPQDAKLPIDAWTKKRICGA